MLEDDPEEHDPLWSQVIKDVRPLSNTQRQHMRVQQDFRKYCQVASPTLFPHDPMFPSLDMTAEITSPKQSISRKRSRRMRIEATLDLHGHTRAQAQHRLQVFCHHAHIQGKTWILVITGKGASRNQATLRTLMPKWLQQIPEVVAYAHARPCHGGEGAFYVQIASQKRL